MKWLKRIVLGLLAAAGLFVIIGLLLPRQYQVQRSIVIGTSPATIYPYLVNLKRWPEWSAWTTAQDPTLVYSYEGPEEGPGAISRWEAKKLGQGEMKLTTADPIQGVRFDLSFEHGQYRCVSALLFAPTDDGTQLTWSMAGDSGANPIGRWFNLFMDRMVGPDLEAGLAKLKRLAEGR
jgi:hypothetical protein